LSPRDAEAKREHDVEDESHPVIIAGYGRFGQIVSRLLTANGIGNTVLDNNPGHIDMLRSFGAKCFYGDAAREDLLRAAGAERARVLVVAVDDADAASEIVSHARKAFPHLELVVRTRGRPDAQDLLKVGVRHVVRETFGSALDAGVEVLRCLGWRAHQAHRRAATFRHHDDSMMRELAAERDDQKRYVSEMNRRRAILEDVLKQDRAHLEDIRDDAWDGAPPREESATDNPSAA
jgi:voltage-gated potassium channel Kch